MKILGVRVDTISKQKLGDVVSASLKGGAKIKASKLNPEFIQRCQRDTHFRDVINNSDLNIIDGRGIQLAARYLTLPITNNKILLPIQAWLQMLASGISVIFNRKFLSYPVKEVIPGVEAFSIMLNAAQSSGESVFLFGSSSETLRKAVDSLKTQFPTLKIAGILDGYGFQTDSSVDPVDIINKTDARLLIVALGSPKQEYWISDNMNRLKTVRVAVGEGGTLDRIANPKQLAPKFVNKIGLEWLWRMLFNKSKTASRNRFQRFWVSVPSFMAIIVKWKVKNGEAKIED